MPKAHAPAVVALLLSIAGCTVGPDYERPEIEVLEQWRGANLERAESPEELARWWRRFRDPILDRLIDRAERDNPGVLTALHRIEETRASYGLTRGERWPDLDGVGSFRRTRASKNGTNSRVAGFQFKERDLWTVGAEATWELDLWGRVRRAVEAGHAELEASVEDYRDVLVLMQAEIARNYVDLRAMQQRLTIAERNVALQERSLDLAKEKARAGVVGELDVRQAETNVEITRSALPQLRAKIEIQIHRLAVLVGQRPDALTAVLETRGRIPEAPSELLAPMPADLLRQRPDIRRAERRLAAATARIGVRTADLYPRFTLFGSLNWESTKVSKLVDNDSLGFGLGPSFRWNLFDGGRVDSLIEIEDARTQQALFEYRDTVHRALADVEDALSAHREEKLRRAILERAVVSAKRATELVLTSYEAGVADMTRVLEAQQSLKSAEDMLAQSDATLSASLVALYRAFGGGWIHEDE